MILRTRSLIIRRILIASAFAAMLGTILPVEQVDARKGRAASRPIPRAKPIRVRPRFSQEQRCAQTFATGDWVGLPPLARDGSHALTIKNDVDTHAIVKVSTLPDDTYARFYVAPGSRWTLQGIPDGQYHIRYVAYPILGVDCEEVLYADDVENFRARRASRSPSMLMVRAIRQNSNTRSMPLLMGTCSRATLV